MSSIGPAFSKDLENGLPRLLKHLWRIVYRDAILDFYMGVVTLKSPITKPVET